MNDEELAAKLYPSMRQEAVDDAAASAALQQPPPKEAEKAPAANELTQQQIADQLFKPKEPARVSDDAIPQAVRDLRDGDAERKMFGAQGTHKEAISEKDIEGDDITDEQKAAVAAEYREMFADAELSVPEAREVVSLAQALAADPPTPETEAEWIRQGSKRLIELNNGDIDAANADLALAKKLVQRDPRVAKILDATRLGSSPKVVELLVQKARAEKARGRL